MHESWMTVDHKPEGKVSSIPPTANRRALADPTALPRLRVHVFQISGDIIPRLWRVFLRLHVLPFPLLHVSLANLIASTRGDRQAILRDSS